MKRLQGSSHQIFHMHPEGIWQRHLLILRGRVFRLQTSRYADHIFWLDFINCGIVNSSSDGRLHVKTLKGILLHAF